MKDQAKHLVYIMDGVDGLFDASNGEAMAEITKTDLRQVFDMLRPYANFDKAPRTVTILTKMMQAMADDNASAPDAVAEYALQDEPVNSMLYDAIHNLASLLVEDVGRYE